MRSVLMIKRQPMKGVSAMLLPMLIPFVVVVAVEADPVSRDADAVVQKWVAAQEGVHAIQATYHHFEYNHIFCTVTESRGEIYCASPTLGFYSLSPRLRKNGSETVKVDNKTYKLRPRRACRIVWKDDVVIFTDEERKQYHRLPRDFSFLGAQRFPSIIEMFPFLPGLPDKNAITGWDFRIVSETETKVHIEGSPPEALANRFRSCDLMLQKPAWNLSAVRYFDTTSREMVFVFQSVNRNPDKLPDIDLSGYTAFEAVSSD